MFNAGLKNIVESIIFASQDEISTKQIKEILDNFKIASKAAEIEEIVEALNTEYLSNDSAFEIIKIAGGYQFATRKKFAHFVGKLYTETQRKKLSPSAIETLSIIAYKQPITRSDIEFIRGVNVDYIVNSLLERDLITIKGRASGPGRPILYGTTNNFLKVLGLNTIEDLPKLREINEILKNEKIDGITEADIDLFNSVNTDSNLFSAGTQNPQGAAITEATDTGENATQEGEKEVVSDEELAKEETEEEELENDIDKDDDIDDIIDDEEEENENEEYEDDEDEMDEDDEGNEEDDEDDEIDDVIEEGKTEKGNKSEESKEEKASEDGK